MNGTSSSPSSIEAPATDPRIIDALRRYWGFDTLRPLQREAIAAGLEGCDSLLVMPTGGGKSLCYQLPPLVAGRMDIVISPLIALMKDQVDGLRQNGYPAAAIHSQLDARELSEIREQVRGGALHLLFITPERMLTERFLEFVGRQRIRHFAIDEAHCISQWGHDFRKEYRGLRILKERFPDASVHAFTATATPRVQQDIVEQLGLIDPHVLIGTFDRPNLVYRIVPKIDVDRQALEVIRRHKSEAAIVYCITRKDTEELAAFLQLNDVKALPYHAGLDRQVRRRAQDAFAAEEIDVIVATVAFGMGIDRSNVRCVVHASMPKTIEHYQQETGRAGRDGLEAECVLLYSGGDAARWERLITQSAKDADEPESVIAAQIELLSHMRGLCGTLDCRHRALSRYFGQVYPHDNCGACDVCLGEVEGMAESTTIAQKILSCVYRLDQRYGVGYVAEVLHGAKTAQVLERGHDTLSTYGLLGGMPGESITNLLYQMLDLGLLARSAGDRPVLQLTEEAGLVLRGEREVRLVEPRSGPVRKSKLAAQSWEGVDEGLFEALRSLRRTMAQQREVPAFVIFSDNVLRELARRRPSTLDAMRSISGIGEKKLADFGSGFLELIMSHCKEHGLETDVRLIRRAPRERARRPDSLKERAMQMFADGGSIDEVAEATGRARSTVGGYLVEFIEAARPESVAAWVDDETCRRVIHAASILGADRLKPVYEWLNEDVPYEEIRVVLTHYAVRGAD